MASLPLSFLLFSFFFVFFAKPTGHTLRQIWTNEGSKRVVSCKEVLFGGVNNVPLSFKGQAPKITEIWGVNKTFKPERQKMQILITWKLLNWSLWNFYRGYVPQMILHGWSRGSSQQIQDDGHHVTKLIWVTSSNEGMDHKCVDLSDDKRYLNHIWYRAQVPHCQHAGMCQIHITWKSKMVAAAILIFGKMSITPDWIKMFSPNFRGRCFMAMRRWPCEQKSEPALNLLDVIKWTSGA